jgi:hypothetical protein
VEYFNRRPRIGTLSTADKAGRVNAAVFGSLKMIDEMTVVMGLGRNRTLANLRENPNAVYMIMAPGGSVPEWKGVRAYLEMLDCETEGKRLDEIIADIAERAGKAGADMIYAAVTFRVEDVRPIADFGQGWEKSLEDCFYRATREEIEG